MRTQCAQSLAMQRHGAARAHTGAHAARACCDGHPVRVCTHIDTGSRRMAHCASGRRCAHGHRPRIRGDCASAGLAPALGELDPSMHTFFSVSPPTATEASVFIQGAGGTDGAGSRGPEAQMARLYINTCVYLCSDAHAVRTEPCDGAVVRQTHTHTPQQAARANGRTVSGYCARQKAKARGRQ